MTKLRSVDGTTIWRTPEQRFAALPDYPFRPNYADVTDKRLGALAGLYGLFGVFPFAFLAI